MHVAQRPHIASPTPLRPRPYTPPSSCIDSAHPGASMNNSVIYPKNPESWPVGICSATEEGSRCNAEALTGAKLWIGLAVQESRYLWLLINRFPTRRGEKQYITKTVDQNSTRYYGEKLGAAGGNARCSGYRYECATFVTRGSIWT